MPAKKADLSFDKYSEHNVQPYSEGLSHLLQKMMEDVLETLGDDQSFNICDLGCGDGATLYALHVTGFLRKARYITGVDISPIRLQRIECLKNIGLDVSGVLCDVCQVTQLIKEPQDVVICSQVIEHVPNDELLVDEIYALLRKGGRAYVGSVLRKRPLIYIYRNNGKWVLDPTHIHEYSSEEEFLALFRDKFKLISFNVGPVAHSLHVILAVVLSKIGILSPEQRRNLLAKRINVIKIPIPGFSIIESIIEKI